MKRTSHEGIYVGFLDERDYVTADKRTIRVWYWEITCVDCREMFETFQVVRDFPRPRLDLGRLLRRCPACRAANRSRPNVG